MFSSGPCPNLKRYLATFQLKSLGLEILPPSRKKDGGDVRQSQKKIGEKVEKNIREKIKKKVEEKVVKKSGNKLDPLPPTNFVAELDHSILIIF